MNAESGIIECANSPDVAHDYWKALDDEDMIFALSPESSRRAEKKLSHAQLSDTAQFFPIKVEASEGSQLHAIPQQHSMFSAPTEGNAWESMHQETIAVDNRSTALNFDPSSFPSDFLNYVPMNVPCEFSNSSAVPYPQIEANEEEYAHKMRASGQPVRIISPAMTVPRAPMRKRRKKIPFGEGEGDETVVPPTFDTSIVKNCAGEQPAGCSSKEIEGLLKLLGSGEVTLHVYENAQRLYIRYVNENGMWQMRDVADFVNVKFHSDSDTTMPLPTGPVETVAATPFQPMDNGVMQPMSLIAVNQHNGIPNTLTNGYPNIMPVPMGEGIFPFGMLGEVPGFPGAAQGQCMMIPTQPVKELSRDLVLEFKRKEHYWRRGIWVRVVVDVIAKNGNGTPVREAGGSINVALLSSKGKVIKKACEKCSKYYFRYKNIESSGQAPAFEIEERERCTAVRGGRASFNMRVWECSHHYLSPHTLLFSWVDPCNPCMRTVALCPKEIVISSGSGQEKKLKEMTVSREEVFRDFMDALIMMESAQYVRAVEALRCIRWKCFHFLGMGLPSIVDEKIGDCFLRMGDYRGSIEHFARAIGHLNKIKEGMDSQLWLYMRALLYLKLSNASYSRERDSVQVMNLKKASKTLKKSRAAFQLALEYEQQQAIIEAEVTKAEVDNDPCGNPGKDTILYNFVKNYLRYSYYQTMTGLFLKMKPFQLAMGDLAGSITYEAIAMALEETEKSLNGLLKDEKSWFSTDMLALFGPLVEKLHTGVDSLKKLLHSPFATNKVITQFSLMGEHSMIPPEQVGEKVLLVLRELKQAADEAEELHQKGHRTICICKCLLALFMYLGGQLTREEALRSVDEVLRLIEKFWKTNGGISGGRFECQQVASIAEYIRSNQRNPSNPFAVFDDREHMQLYRMWVHSPLDIAVWALQVQVTWV